MKEHPILFSGKMVRAILAGKKTQTRRIAKPQPPGGRCWHDNKLWWWDRRPRAHWEKPKYKAGDKLWVRETAYISPPNFSHNMDETHRDYENQPRIVDYCADHPPNGYSEAADDFGVKKTPSIFMPKWASRIMLDIEDVRVERLQQIGGTDAWAEGELTVRLFIELWDSLNAKRGHGWDPNPWVWVIAFEQQPAADV